ncbi:MAG: type II toxin-antitoxin system Phd/YefM family antitoxin [Chloroflexi bacterium]|nr:type II toxin-antitoxin system Phd/YefM family antitoxin [Chloroflexota bacterium]
MNAREPLTRTLKATEARRQWDALLDQVSKEKARVLVEKDGVPVAAIVSPEDLERLVEYERRREEGFKVLHEISAAFKDVPREEIEREVDKAVAQVREEMRRERKAAEQAEQRRSA